MQLPFYGERLRTTNILEGNFHLKRNLERAVKIALTTESYLSVEYLLNGILFYTKSHCF